MEHQLKAWAEERGYGMAVTNDKSLIDLSRTIDDLNLPTIVDRNLFRQGIQSMIEDLKTMAKVSSVILIAVPRPAHTLDFDTGKGIFSTVIPPTYVNYRLLADQILTDFSHYLSVSGSEFSLFKPFLKTLAVQTDLASYGKNNITYIKEFGSYFQLIGLISLLKLKPFVDTDGKNQRQMEACRNCQACIRNCPTQSINQERFLINAHTCLTFLNEYPGSLASFEGIKTKAKCIVGCLECQEICPANKGKLKYEDAPVKFSAAETAFLLSENPDPEGEMAAAIMKKMEILGMPHYAKVLGRNLNWLNER